MAGCLVVPTNSLRGMENCSVGLISPKADIINGVPMENQSPPAAFGKDMAASHDQRVAKLAPMREALHLFIRMVFGALPDNARMLCVGAGTGPELIYLAQAFPGWQYVAVDRSGAMLDVCRNRARENGVAERCTFHEGTFETLGEVEPFDAATSLLVSRFIFDTDARREFYAQIAQRLRPGGILVSADLATGASAPQYKSLYEVWERTMRYTGMPVLSIDRIGDKMSVLAPQEVRAIIASAGFEEPVQFFQALLIHACYAKRLGV